MLGIIVENEQNRQHHAQILLENGYLESEYANLYVSGSKEALILTKGELMQKETVFLDFYPQIACHLTKSENDMAEFVRLRHLSTTQVETNPDEPVLAQLWN